MAEDGKTFSAKQVASRIGTDAKQLRKFFRDPNSGYDAVGQGGRYDFPEADISKIKSAFDTWNSTKTRRNRAVSPQAKLASAAGLIPGQRKDSPTPTVRRSKDNKEGLHHNALDEDTLQDRFAGISARVKKHGLTMKQGRFVEDPHRRGLTIMSNTEVAAHDKWEQAKAQELDFTDVSDADPYRAPTDDEIFALMEEDDELED